MPDDASPPPTGPMSALAQLSGRSLDELYRLFRLEGAPAPTGHVAGVPIYEIEPCLRWLHPGSELETELPGYIDPSRSLDLRPRSV